MVRILLRMEEIENEIPGISRIAEGIIYSVFALSGKKVEIVEEDYDIILSDKPLRNSLYLRNKRKESIISQIFGAALTISSLAPERILEEGSPLGIYTYIPKEPSEEDLVYSPAKNVAKVIYFISSSLPGGFLAKIDELVAKFAHREISFYLPEPLSDLPLVIVYLYKRTFFF